MFSKQGLGAEKYYDILNDTLVPTTVVSTGHLIINSRWVYNIKADKSYKGRVVVLQWRPLKQSKLRPPALGGCQSLELKPPGISFSGAGAPITVKAKVARNFPAGAGTTRAEDHKGFPGGVDAIDGRRVSTTVQAGAVKY